jgi:hypothetical protein
MSTYIYIAQFVYSIICVCACVCVVESGGGTALARRLLRNMLQAVCRSQMLVVFGAHLRGAQTTSDFTGKKY